MRTRDTTTFLMHGDPASLSFSCVLCRDSLMQLACRNTLRAESELHHAITASAVQRHQHHCLPQTGKRASIGSRQECHACQVASPHACGQPPLPSNQEDACCTASNNRPQDKQEAACWDSQGISCWQGLTPPAGHSWYPPGRQNKGSLMHRHVA